MLTVLTACTVRAKRFLRSIVKIAVLLYENKLASIIAKLKSLVFRLKATNTRNKRGKTTQNSRKLPWRTMCMFLFLFTAVGKQPIIFRPHLPSGPRGMARKQPGRSSVSICDVFFCLPHDPMNKEKYLKHN